MGRETFMLRLSTMEKARSSVINSPIAVDGKRYRGFRAFDFDTQFHVPRFLVTLLFPGLVVELRLSVSDFGGHFGWGM